MGGDLIESSGARCHAIWWEYMAHNMNDILDAYSVHIYWNYWDIPLHGVRLKDVRRDRDRGAPRRRAEADLRDGVRRARGPAFRGQADASRPATGRTERSCEGRTSPPSSSSGSIIASAQLGYTRRGQVGRVLGQVQRPQLQVLLRDDRPGRRRVAASSRPTTRCSSCSCRRPSAAGRSCGWLPGRTTTGQVGNADRGRRRSSSRTRARADSVTVMGLDTHGARPEHGLCRDSREYSIGGCRRGPRSTWRSGTRPGTARARLPARSGPMPRASPASRCRCTRRSR